MGIALRLLLVLACATSASSVYSQSQTPDSPSDLQTGLASYYASSFEGNRTSSGATFRNASLIAAHPTHPLGTIARVTNLATGAWVDVHILDRGPARGPQRRGVIIDLSQSAAKQLNILRAGLARVSIEVLQWGKSDKTSESRSESRITLPRIFSPQPIISPQPITADSSE